MADTPWRKPDGAVEPVNEFHLLYMCMAGMQERFMDEAAADADQLITPEFGELLGALANFSNEMGHITTLLDRLRRDKPRLWEAWRRAVPWDGHVPPAAVATARASEQALTKPDHPLNKALKTLMDLRSTVYSYGMDADDPDLRAAYMAAYNNLNRTVAKIMTAKNIMAGDGDGR